jgi:hypothetical protein
MAEDLSAINERLSKLFENHIVQILPLFVSRQAQRSFLNDDFSMESVVLRYP